jgi:CBS domain containing-hemolysin-like protein
MQSPTGTSPGEQLPLIIAVIVLLAFSAFFSGSETALFSLQRSNVAGMSSGSKKQRRVASLMAAPRKLLVTILFGNLLVNITNTSVVTVLAIKLFGERGVGYAMIVMTVLILMFGEILPKSVAIKRAGGLSQMIAIPIRFLMYLFYPVIVILGKIADSSVEICRKLFGETKEKYASRELATAVEMGYREGLFDEFEKEILINLFLFAETDVHEILTPRVEVFTLDVNTAFQDAVARVRDRGFTRVPLYEGNPEKIVGILHTKDLLRYSRNERITLRELVRPVSFVPETKPIRDLLGELTASRNHVVIVVDEHGSFEGIVTLEDILEEIIGDIRDRREPRVGDYNLIDEDHIVVVGSMRLEDLNDVFRTDLDSKEVETIGGYICDLLGRIPGDGESFVSEDLRFLVLSACKTRVEKIKIEKLGEEAGQ